MLQVSVQYMLYAVSEKVLCVTRLKVTLTKNTNANQ